MAGGREAIDFHQSNLQETKNSVSWPFKLEAKSPNAVAL